MSIIIDAIEKFKIQEKYGYMEYSKGKVTLT